jgi:hypothetical protein
MSKTRRAPHPPPVDDYVSVQQLIRQVRVMERIMEWVDAQPEMRKFYCELHIEIMHILGEEFAPHAMTLALTIAQLENAYPEIREALADADPA